MSETLAQKLIQSCSDEELESLARALKLERADREVVAKQKARPWTQAEWDKLIRLRTELDKQGYERDFSINKKLCCRLTGTVRWEFNPETNDTIGYKIADREWNINASMHSDDPDEIDWELLPEVKKLLADYEAVVNKYKAEIGRLAKKYKITEQSIRDAVGEVFLGNLRSIE